MTILVLTHKCVFVQKLGSQIRATSTEPITVYICLRSWVGPRSWADPRSWVNSVTNVMSLMEGVVYFGAIIGVRRVTSLTEDMIYFGVFDFTGNSKLI